MGVHTLLWDSSLDTGLAWLLAVTLDFASTTLGTGDGLSNASTLLSPNRSHCALSGTRADHGGQLVKRFCLHY